MREKKYIKLFYIYSKMDIFILNYLYQIIGIFAENKINI